MSPHEKEEPEIDIPLAPAIAIPTPIPFADPVLATNSLSSGGATIDTSSINTPQPIEQPPSQRTVDVLAPSDLPAGFEFYVDDPATPHVSLLVQVPAGGVLATQRFAAIVVREVNRGSHNIPHGKWRDGLCDCWNLGCCHPQWCLTFWCSPCALGQVLTRLKLNLWSSPKQAVGMGWTAFQILFAVQIIYVVVVPLLGAVTGYTFVNDVIFAMMFIFMLIVTLYLRQYVRNKYQIPEQTCCCKEDGCCRGCEDFCCALWCQSCTICQLARHTADYHNYKAGCCTEDGLATGTPSVV